MLVTHHIHCTKSCLTDCHPAATTSPIQRASGSSDLTRSAGLSPSGLKWLKKFCAAICCAKPCAATLERGSIVKGPLLGFVTSSLKSENAQTWLISSANTSGAWRIALAQSAICGKNKVQFENGCIDVYLFPQIHIDSIEICYLLILTFRVQAHLRQTNKIYKMWQRWQVQTD